MKKNLTPILVLFLICLIPLEGTFAGTWKDSAQSTGNELTPNEDTEQFHVQWHQKPSMVADQWFTRARFGMFYTWGFAVGGTGSSSIAHDAPPKYTNVEDFEKDAPSAEVFAGNLVSLTRRVGARYLIITLHHSCNGHMVIFPTRNEMFLHKTTRDYLGAILEEAHRHDIKVIGYTSGGPHHWKSRGTLWLNDISGDPDNKAEFSTPANMSYFIKQQRLFFEEIKERYEAVGGLDGIWVDGCIPWSLEPYNGFAMLRELFPDAVLTGNNQQQFISPDMDVAASEFVIPGIMDLPYNRPSGLTRPREKWRPSVQLRNDYVEDIPTCNGWWYKGEDRLGKEYREDTTFWIREMICSLGQRRKWNYAMGMGVKIDGTAPEETLPMVEAMEKFMAWASPAIYNTMGGYGGPIYPGWMNGGAFGSVTTSLTEPGVHYLLVTQAPSGTQWPTDMLLVQNDWISEVKSVTDLHTGEPQEFELRGVLHIKEIDWTDIDEFGAKVFRIVLPAGE